MTSRLRSLWICGVGSLATLLLAPGCDDASNAGPIVYVESPQVATALKERPKLRETIRDTLAKLYGDSPQEPRVPADSVLPDAGRRLTSFGAAKDSGAASASDAPHGDGGLALYRRYCLHCHGLQGGGDGPTGALLFPRPRDFRRGLYKFTSTAPAESKPTREDLRRSIRLGLGKTSMPAFGALMTEDEIDQVVDYVIFLSIRGETEKSLLDETKNIDGDDPSGLDADTVKEFVANISRKWKAADGQVVNPKVRKPPRSSESVERGKAIFLGVNKTGKTVDCTSCHGIHGRGDGKSFIDPKVFDKVVFRGRTIEEAIAARYAELPAERAAWAKAGVESKAPPLEDFESYRKRLLGEWNPGSIDDWGNPLRPADLTKGSYKGGRRPIDLYWRIAKGINGVKMPAHASILTDAQIWDVVDFVLALGDDPSLLDDAESLRPGAKMAEAAPRRDATASVSSAPKSNP